MQLSKHPKELWILSLSELCERFAFWGVGNLLVLYLIEYYHFPEEKATLVYAYFSGSAAFLPFLGGFIGDRWNYQMPILLGALINAIGCFMIASGIPSLLYIALIVIALGYGLFTPSLITVLGYTYKNQLTLREAGFSIYYAAINTGVFLALISVSTIAKWFNWHAAFALTGIVQLIGLLPIIWYLTHHKELYLELKKYQECHQEKTSPLSKSDLKKLSVLFFFYFISMFFWAAYNQAYSSMEIFAHKFMNTTVFGVKIPEGIFISSESFFLILLAPCLATLYHFLQKRKQDPTFSTKISLSLLFISLCFFIMMFASYGIPLHAKSAVTAWGYIIFAYFCMAIGEMLFGPIGLSMVSRLSPPKYTAMMIGLWFVSMGIAFLAGGLLAGLITKISLFTFFSIFALLTAIPGAFLLMISKKVPYS